MTRLAVTAAFLLAAASMAHAEDAEIVKIDGNPNKSRAQIIAAAEEVCRIARSHDFSDDFGSQEECVDNTLYGVIMWQFGGRSDELRLAAF